MNRAKLFIENIFVYGGIQALNKFLPLIFLPLIVSLIESPEEFGMFDMFSIFVALSSTITTLGVYDAGFRENFDKESNNNTKEITSTITVIIILASFFLILLIFFLKNFIAKSFWSSIEHSNIVLISALAIFFHSLQTIGIMPLRFKNDRRYYAFYLIGNSILYYTFAILFLKINPKAVSLMFATVAASFILVINLFFINKEYFNVRLFSLKLSKSLLKIGLPLVPVFLSFWLLQSIGRIMIAKNLGLYEQGIYALGNKVASISMLVQVAFTAGFSYFSFSTMNYNDQVLNRTFLLKYLMLFSLIFCSFVLFFQKFIFSILFPSEYQLGIKVFPFLLFFPLLFVMYQTVSNQFTIAKKTYITTVILIIAVVITYLMNIFLINSDGIIGSAFGTFIGYYSLLMISIIVAIQLKLLLFDFKLVFLLILIFSEFLLIFLDLFNVYFISIFVLIFLLIFYRKDFYTIFSKFKSIIKTY